MKTKLELYQEASALAKTLLGEPSPKKISDAITAKFDSLDLHENDWSPFVNMVHETMAKFEALQSQPTETEKLAQAATKKTAPVA